MKAMFGLLGVLLLSGASLAVAQQPRQPPQPPDPLGGNLFPPELIMQNQQALGLTEDQKGYMIAEIQRTQEQATAVQWRLQREVEKLGALIRQERVDEAQVLAQIDSVLALERDMKRIQMTLLVRLKNHLTAEQQTYLRERLTPREP